MNIDNKFTFVKLMTMGLSFGSFIYVSHTLLRTVSKWRILRRSNHLIDSLVFKMKNPLPSTCVVSTHTEWENVYQQLAKHCSEIPILGFDCEWVSMGGRTSPVALIQLASHQGTCALVRVCRISTLPPSLVSLLSNPEVLKVGVATWEDASKLQTDMNLVMRGAFDIRHLIMHHPQRENLLKKPGLSGLSEKLLDFKLNKKFTVRCSDWECDQLTDIQIQYAAQDALASIAVCLKLITETEIARKKWEMFEHTHILIRKWAKSCAEIRADSKFRMRGLPSPSPVKSNLKQSPLPKQSSSGSSRAYAVRKTPLYDNCILQAPDGQPLCTCDTKKALWYVAKDRGSVVSENPMTVRLNFEPAGRPTSDYDQYYLLEKSNLCVVCGTQDSILRKNIVPHEYRRNFPAFLKDHKSHDVLLMCLECHTRSNLLDNHLKNELAVECQAPIGTERDVKMKLDRNLSNVQRAANALIQSRHSLPAARILELEEKVKTYYQVDELTAEILDKAGGMEVHVQNADYVPHGLKVVQHFQSLGDDGLYILERRWREHFLDKMQPQFLPALWSVQHHRNPEDKWKRDVQA